MITKFEREKHDARSLGADCDNCPLKDRKPILPVRSKNTKLVIINDAPGTEENYLGKFLAGETEEWFDGQLSILGIDKDQLHCTNAVMCYPPIKGFKEKDWKQALKCCSRRLEREVNATGCKTIQTMGNKAFKVITGRNGVAMPWMGVNLPGGRTTYGEVVTADIPKNAKKTAKRKTFQKTHETDYSAYKVVANTTPFIAGFFEPAWRAVFPVYLHRAWKLANGVADVWSWPEFCLSPNEEALNAVLKMRSSAAVAFDVENVPSTSTVTALGVSDGRLTVSVPLEGYAAGPYGQVPALQEGEMGRRIYQAICDLLSDPKLIKIAHNAAHDITVLRDKGIAVRGEIFDSMLAHAVVCQQLPHNLNFACSVAFPSPRWKSEWGDEDGESKGDEKWVKRDPMALRLYNAKDAYMTYHLYEWLLPRLASYPHGQELFNEYTQLSALCTDIKAVGWCIDDAARQKHIAEIEPTIKDYAEKLNKVADKLGIQNFNPRSSLQLKELFMDKLGCKAVKYSEETGAPSFDEEALLEYRTYPDKRVQVLTDLILKYRGADKLLSTYLKNLPVDPDGRLRSTMNVHGTISGRFSSKKPNIQNIPGDLRDMFVPSPGRWLVKADYSALELRLIAIQAGAPKLMQWFAEGADVHMMNAQAIFGPEATKSQRKFLKGYIYGKMYGAKDEKVWDMLRKEDPAITLEQVNFLSAAIKEQHPELFIHQARVVANAKKLGYVETSISGRRRYFFNPNDHKVTTEAPNHPVQGTGADIINKAFIRLASMLDPTKGAILGQVHDEIVLEHEDPAEGFRLLKHCMEYLVKLNGAEHSIPIEVSVGKNWKDVQTVHNQEEARNIGTT